MKKITILLLAVLFTSLTFAQKMQENLIPATVLAAFKTKFPTVTKASWEMENKTEYEAEFKVNGEELSASFDTKGNWLETETEIKVTALPIAIQSTLKKDFADFKIEEASKIESLKNGMCYEAEIEKGKESYDILFSPDGKVLSKTKLEHKER